MRNKNENSIWKTASIVLAVLLLITLISGVLLLVLGNGSSSAEIKGRQKAEFTILSPSNNMTECKSTIEIQGTGKTSVPHAVSEGHRYEIITTRMTWAEAEAYCNSRGGHLATVTSKDEYQTILNLASSSGRKVLWLGGSKNVNQEFVWNTGEAFTYSEWLAGEPNNEGGNENYLVMFDVKGSWVWADVPADLSPYYAADKVGFVCEYE